MKGPLRSCAGRFGSCGFRSLTGSCSESGQLEKVDFASGVGNLSSSLGSGARAWLTHDLEARAQPLAGEPGQIRRGSGWEWQREQAQGWASRRAQEEPPGPQLKPRFCRESSHVCKMQLSAQSLSTRAAAFGSPHQSTGPWTRMDMCPHAPQPHPLPIHSKLGVPGTAAEGPVLQVPHPQGSFEGRPLDSPAGLRHGHRRSSNPDTPR